MQGDLENGALNNLGNKVEPMLLSAMNSYPEMNGENGGVSNGDVELESLTPAVSGPAVATIDDMLLASDMHADKTQVLTAATGGSIAAAASTSARHEVAVNGSNSNYSSSSSMDGHSYCDDDDAEGAAAVKTMRNGADASGSECGDDEDVVAATVNGLREHVARLVDRDADAESATLITIDDSTRLNTTSSRLDEDCDILSNRNTCENTEDCCKIVDEIEMRLNGENSVQSSVETIIDNNFSTNSELSDYKYVSEVDRVGGRENRKYPRQHLVGCSHFCRFSSLELGSALSSFFSTLSLLFENVLV